MILIVYFIIIAIQNVKLQTTTDVPPTSDNIVEETQHAICKIATEEIQATANASITRQLKGVCNSNDMHEKLIQLENRIIKKIIELQMMLDPNLNNVLLYKNLPETITTKRPIIVDDILTTTLRPLPKIKKKKIGKSYAEKTKVFDLDVLKNNNTIIVGEYGNTFSYYWRIEEIEKTLNERDLFTTSPHFYIKGAINYIKLTPHHLDSKYMCLELENVLPMFYKYRFMVLNQYNTKNDLSSQLLCKLESFAQMYRVSYEKLNNYIVNDSIVIKLLIYLDL